jgi:peptidylprolyl isomerase
MHGYAVAQTTETASQAPQTSTSAEAVTTHTATGALQSTGTLEQTTASAAAPTGQWTTLPSGVSYKDLVLGTGTEATTLSQISVHYTLTLDNGNVVDSSRTRNVPRPFKFKPGTKQTIVGFEEGIIGMKVGGRRLITVPPSMGYGAKANGGIPANSTLHFDIEVVGVKPF